MCVCVGVCVCVLESRLSPITETRHLQPKSLASKHKPWQMGALVIAFAQPPSRSAAWPRRETALDVWLFGLGVYG